MSPGMRGTGLVRGDFARPGWIVGAVLCVAFGLLAMRLGSQRAWAEDELPPDIEFFTNHDCPHCRDAEAFLRRLQDERPELLIAALDPLIDARSRARFADLVARAGVKAASTPAFFVRGRLIVGWSGPDGTGRVLEDLLDGVDVADIEGGAGCVVDLTKKAGETQAPCADARDRTIALPVFGEIRPRDLGLPVFTAVLGLVDGFNPCAMWVLLFLLSLLVHLGSRARMFAIAGTFVLVSGLVYFAFMAAWFTIFDVLGSARVIQVVLGLAAVLIGLVHMKDFFAFHKGLSFSIPDAAKPGIYAKVQRILAARNLTGALVTVISLALLVNVVELLCTAGLPAVYTSVLASHDLPAWQTYAYLGLYQVFYMFDDMLMLTIAIVTLSRKRLQERAGRWLKLVSGLVMALLGGLLIFAPGALSW